jgi:hypothetical protein
MVLFKNYLNDSIKINLNKIQRLLIIILFNISKTYLFIIAELYQHFERTCRNLSKQIVFVLTVLLTICERNQNRQNLFCNYKALI